MSLLAAGAERKEDGSVVSGSGPVNESWRLCICHHWVSLQMRLSRYPEEACAVERQTRRSLLHEVVVSAAGSAAVHEESSRGGCYDDDTNNTDGVIVPSSVLRCIYFSCPRAMMLQDALQGYTPLHCALATITTAHVAPTMEALTVSEQQQQKRQQPDQNSSPSFNLISSLLDLCLGRSADVEEDNDSLLNDDDDDDTSTTASTSDSSNSSAPENEVACLLLQDHLGDTPMHTACRHGHGCQKHIFLAIMEACPSALVTFNHDGMTPLRLLWNALKRYLSIGTGCTGTTSTTYPDTKAACGAGAANPGLAQKSTSSSDTALDKVIKQIKTYNDLTKYPIIKDTWEKSLMCLYMLAMTLETKSTDEADVSKSETDEILMLLAGQEDDSSDGNSTFSSQSQPPELPFQILHSIASTDCDGVLMELALKFYPDEQPDEDGRSVFEVAMARQAIIPHASPDGGTYKSVAEVLMKHNPDLQSTLSLKQKADVSSSNPERKRSLLHLMEHSSSNDDTFSSLNAKGIEPDTDGMLPMPAEVVAFGSSKKNRPTISPTANPYHQEEEEEEESNFFFELD